MRLAFEVRQPNRKYTYIIIWKIGDKKITPTDKVYSTQNTALAAFLYSQGFEYLGTDKSKYPVVSFQFENASKNFTEAVTAFEIGKAEGNIVLFFRAYKKMLDEIHSS